MHLLTQELRHKLPALYATEGAEDPQVICRFFLPMTKWLWYPIEFDGDDTFYGYVIGQHSELSYFSLCELERLRGLFHLCVTRDRYFQSQRLSQIKGTSKHEEAYATL